MIKHDLSLHSTPITCVKLVDQRLMSGKSSGIISIYDIPSKQLLAEITAHSRCISWLDISFHRDLVSINN